MKIKFSKKIVCKNVPFTKYISEDLLHHKYILNSKKKGALSPPAIFFDRDGVIIKDKNYISNPNFVEFELGAKALILELKKKGWKIVIVTNQSGIYRNYFTWQDYENVSERIIKLLGLPSPIDAIYSNGFGPSMAVGTWRKPNPEMFFEASKDLNINLNSSIIIGDRFSDLIAGLRAGLKSVVHLKTGHGLTERNTIKKNIFKRDNEDYYRLSYADELNEPLIKFVDNLTNLLEDNTLV